MTIEIANLRTGEEQATAARSRLYQVLANAFAFPDQELFEAIRDGTLAQSLAQIAASLPYPLPDAIRPQLREAGDSYVDFESEYVRLFDVGPAGPPCPLYGGVYAGDRMRTMEDATRFYNFFDLRIAPDLRELPDHITTELEFMHYLTFRETEARQQGHDPGSLLRAERDFLSRHLCRWVPRMRERLAKQTTLPFLPALVDFALAFFEADRAYASQAAEHCS